MNILVLNAGSSSLKYKLFDMPSERILAHGSLDNPGGDGIQAAAEAAVKQTHTLGIDAVGHRVVHGGQYFIGPTRITKDALKKLRSLKQIDPLHNPTEVSMIETAMHRIPGIPNWAVFDTAFHRTIPEVASRYAVPSQLSKKLGIKRYGFHGISYQFVTGEVLMAMNRKAVGSKLIICHLGSGASVCAVRDGASVDTSMGFTPLEGLMMGTRCGDIDPGIILHLLRHHNYTAATLDRLLNKESGLLGVSAESADIREIERAADSGSETAKLALDMFAYRIRGYIGRYAAILGGVDALVLTGGIGENSERMRASICAGLSFMGIHVDNRANQGLPSGTIAKISSSNSDLSVWRIPTNEELQIARDTFTELSNPS